jgi:hypothetical protein
MPVLEHEYSLEIEKIRTAFKKKFNSDIIKHLIYRIRQSEKVYSANDDDDDDYEDNDDRRERYCG